MKEEKTFTAQEIADLEGVHLGSVYRWIKDGLVTEIVQMAGKRTRHKIKVTDVKLFLQGGLK